MFAMKEISIPVPNPANMAAGVGAACEGCKNAAGTDQ
jgi:hypothetical protein